MRNYCCPLKLFIQNKLGLILREKCQPLLVTFVFWKLFCIIDEFCKHFDAENAENLLEDNSGVKRRRRQASLSDCEIMTILLYFHFGTFRNFKHYYLFFIKGTMKSYFPKAVSYNRFVELESRVFFQLMFFLNLGAFGRCTGITFVDSTMIPV